MDLEGLEKLMKQKEPKIMKNEQAAALVIESSVWKRINRIRMTLIIPLIAAMTLMFSCQTEDLFDSTYMNETLSSSSPANAPLILVDGIIYPGNLNDINPYDVSSITYLGTSAIRLYGPQAINGIILVATNNGKGLITTKNGKGEGIPIFRVFRYVGLSATKVEEIPAR